MTITRTGITLMGAVVCITLALVSLNCAGPGTMSGRVSLNISDQPVWGPTGYDRATYYYIPDYDIYYSVSDRQYIYRDGAEWRFTATLPSSYSSYDPYHTYKVVIDEDKPYQHNEGHRAKYKNFKGVKDQPVIRDSHDRRYFVNKDHPEHDKWVRDQH
jgi:hypothetical protein